MTEKPKSAAAAPPNKYRLIVGDMVNEAAFNLAITALIHSGWRCQGGVAFFEDGRRMGQAMVRI